MQSLMKVEGLAWSGSRSGPTAQANDSQSRPELKDNWTGRRLKGQESRSAFAGISGLACGGVTGPYLAPSFSPHESA